MVLPHLINETFHWIDHTQRSRRKWGARGELDKPMDIPMEQNRYKEYSTQLVDLVADCLKIDYWQRPTLQSIHTAICEYMGISPSPNAFIHDFPDEPLELWEVYCDDRVADRLTYDRLWDIYGIGQPYDKGHKTFTVKPGTPESDR